MANQAIINATAVVVLQLDSADINLSGTYSVTLASAPELAVTVKLHMGNDGSKL